MTYNIWANDHQSLSMPGEWDELIDENAKLRARLEKARLTCKELIAYCDRNMFNFQLEKANDFIRRLDIILTAPEED